MTKFQKWLVKNLFQVSDYPVLFRDLLEANALFNEKMPVDMAKLHYKFKLFNTYALYTALCVGVFGAFLLATHYGLTKIDVHFSFVTTVIATSLVFIGFDAFRAYARKLITKQLIERAWAVHFPHFAYEKYSDLVASIYQDAIKKEIPRNALENYVLEQIIAHSK